MVKGLAHKTRNGGWSEEKKEQRECRYQPDWQASGINISKRSSTDTHCSPCNTDISIGHGGVHDTKKDFITPKHQEMVKVTSSNVSH